MVLFNVRPVKDIAQVKSEIEKIIARQKRGSEDDLSAFRGEMGDLLSAVTEFHQEWKKPPVVFRVARVRVGNNTHTFKENVVLPDIKHDLDLILQMQNHTRKEKGLPEVKMPLFVQPDEISLAYKEGRCDFEGGNIESQLAIIFQKGAVMWVGFVFGRDYVLLQS
ncbi:hypothetical protein [Candidatus Nitrososphaera sp. FF02]|uniref:hypothetical protein n=1 Tax=Candidatus Nitrososphaera sp. FF02 TaxID=3398226 RepID=UPI0039E828F3